MAPLLMLLLGGCADLKSGDIFAPGDEGAPTTSFTLSASSPATQGDSVFIGGSFAKETPDNVEDWEFFGFVGQGGQIEGTYSRAVWAAGEPYSIRLGVKTNGYVYPILDGIKANGVPITAFSYSEYIVLRLFQVNRTAEGVAYIDPIRDDNWRRIETTTWTNGIYTTDPDSLFLNDPMSEHVPVLALNAWNSFKLMPCTWDPQGQSWVQQTTLLKPGPYLLRFEKTTGQPVYAGCHIGNLVLNHLVNGAAPGYPPWWLFRIVVSENGTITNGGPNNLVYFITIGHGQ